jgi:FkbM family methyltransferase
MNISFSDFIPPLFSRIAKKIQARIDKEPHYPFSQLPRKMSPKWILDVGANVGQVTLAALKSYPDCKVICFEPVAETFQKLKENTKGFENRLTFFNMALSDANGQGEINITNSHGANSIIPQSDLHKKVTGVYEVSKQTIKLVRLDDIAAEFPSQKIDVMKIDVEGFEDKVLQGGFEFISRNVELIIVEIALYRSDSIKTNYVGDIFLFMKKAGFSLINVYDLAPIEGHEYLRLGQMDCIFVNNSRLP